jgi:hypothetical protein
MWYTSAIKILLDDSIDNIVISQGIFQHTNGIRNYSEVVKAQGSIIIQFRGETSEIQ